MSLLIKLNMVKWSGFYESIMLDEYNMKSIRIRDFFSIVNFYINVDDKYDDDWVPFVVIK